MSAVVYGKHLRPFEDVHRSPPIVFKRLRYTSSLSPSDNMSRLISLFPAMDSQLVENVFESCDENMDHSIKSLSNLFLNPSKKNILTADDGLVHSDGQLVQVPSSTQSSDVDSSNPEFGQLDGKYGCPNDRVEWVEFLIIEMKNPYDLDEARDRASRILEEFEKTIMSKSGK